MVVYKYPKIPKKYWKPVMFAAQMIREGRGFWTAIKNSARYYNVSESEIEKHLRARQAAGQRAKRYEDSFVRKGTTKALDELDGNYEDIAADLTRKKLAYEEAHGIKKEPNHIKHKHKACAPVDKEDCKKLAQERLAELLRKKSEARAEKIASFLNKNASEMFKPERMRQAVKKLGIKKARDLLDLKYDDVKEVVGKDEASQIKAMLTVYGQKFRE